MLQEHLRLALVILGSFAIVGVLLHGLWSIRKSNKGKSKGSFESQNWEPDFKHEDDFEANGPIYDDVGVSKARVVVNSTDADTDEKEDIETFSAKETSGHRLKSIRSIKFTPIKSGQ